MRNSRREGENEENENLEERKKHSETKKERKKEEDGDELVRKRIGIDGEARAPPIFSLSLSPSSSSSSSSFLTSPSCVLSRLLKVHFFPFFLSLSFSSILSRFSSSYYTPSLCSVISS